MNAISPKHQNQMALFEQHVDVCLRFGDTVFELHEVVVQADDVDQRDDGDAEHD